MTNLKLIIQLLKLPLKAKVTFAWDGAARSNVEFAYLAKSGHIVLADYDEGFSSDEDRPVEAPLKTEVRYWFTPPSPEDTEE